MLEEYGDVEGEVIHPAAAPTAVTAAAIVSSDFKENNSNYTKNWKILTQGDSKPMKENKVNFQNFHDKLSMMCTLQVSWSKVCETIMGNCKMIYIRKLNFRKT